MYSHFWNFINSNSSKWGRRVLYLLCVFTSVLFSTPRYWEGWFYYVLLAYPLIVVGILELTKILLPQVESVRTLSLELVENKLENKRLFSWWNNLDKKEHFLWCFLVAIILAFVSLWYNANPSWSRYTDALGIFYIGFMVGDVFYLLLLMQSGIYQIKPMSLKLSPLDPANTIALRKLAETVFSIAVSIGVSLLVLNIVVATASYIFPHLIAGVLIISVMAWVTIILLSIYPHLVFWQIVQAKKQETLQTLEDKIFALYADVKKKGEVSPKIDDMLKLQSQVLKTRSFPISNSEFFGIVSTLLLNFIPLLLGNLKISLPW